MQPLERKVAVVTGGTSGIGYATARRFSSAGAEVYVFGRRHPAPGQFPWPTPVHAISGDVTSMSDLDRLYEEVKQRSGRIDVLFANAGMIEQKLLLDMTPEHVERTLAVNLTGVVFTVQKALPLLADGASIILTGSIAGSKGFPAHGIYSASKAAIRSLARTWTQELKERQIRVNVISPGAIDTPIIDSQATSERHADAMRSQFASLTPLGRIGYADEVADAAFFLAGPGSRYIAGAELFVDGGLAQV